ncbi:MAG: TonB-dependent receptor, partial [Gemmatimonadetes bacterium]|nr:TonB-dependent receptor [Gemmatimonadota bacterium]
MTRQVSGMLILLVASVAVVSGQSADSVGTQEADTTRALPLPPLVVTGTKVPIRANKVGFRISVLRAEELEARRLAYAFDGLRELAGSYIDEAAGPGGPAIVRLRGGDEVFTQILLDGVQMNENGGFFDFQGLVLSNLDRVEVAKGPQSALYGSSAVSGVVQFLTPRGVPGTARLGFLAEGGDASGNGGSFKSSFDASGGSEAFQYSTGAGLAFNRGIYALAHDTWSGDVSLRGDLVTNDELEWTGQFRFVRYEGNLPVRDPGATRVPLDPNARNARSRIVSSVGARFEPSAAWSHELKGTLYWESFLFSDRFDDVMLADGDPFVFDASFDFDTSLRRPGLEYAATYRHDA